MTANTSRWWHRSRHEDRRPLLDARRRIKSAIRAWFEAQEFVEVETACLQVSPGNEAHLHAFRTEWRTEAGLAQPLYLHTSPEFAMKKLLAAGERRIFSFAPVFRNAERSALHSPEFTMLEWYRVDEPYETVMADCSRLLEIASDCTGRSSWSWRGRSCDIGRGVDHVTVDAALRTFACLPLLETITPDGVDFDALSRLTASLGTRVADDDTWSDLFSRILTEKVEPHLGQPRPTILHDYPAHEAALARTSPRDPRVAERFEVYAAGVELANGFGELTDPIEQRRRFEMEMSEKQRIYGERYPLDEDFLAALAHMPSAAGCAMGFDRLVLLAAGGTHIDQVLWTPVATSQD